MGTGQGLRRLAIPAIVLLLAAAAAGQCSSSGLWLSASGGRLGDPWFTGLYGTQGATGMLAADLSPGPVPTFAGPVCLGLTPSLLVHPFTLDVTGHWSAEGFLPPVAANTGSTVSLQALALDVTQPGGWAISNGANVTLRPPRVIFADMGSLFPLPVTPAKFCVYDALTDTIAVPQVNLPAGALVVDRALVPALGWVAFLLSNGHVACHDLASGAQTFDQQIPPGGCGLAVEGTTLYSLQTGSLFGPTVLGSVRSLSLPSGTPGTVCPLPPGASNQFMVLPGQGIAYALMSSLSAPNYTIQPVDVVAGVPLPPIATGPASGALNIWLQVGGVVHALYSGAPNSLGFPPPSPGSLTSIDTLTHTVVHPAPVPLPTGVTPQLWYGPGTSGDALFAYTGSDLLQIDPASLAVTATIPVPGPLWSMTLSPGGTEWLMLVGGAPFTLRRTTVPSLAVTTVASLPDWVTNLGKLAVIPNATVRRAFIACEGKVLPFDTDPAKAPAFEVALPFRPTTMIVD